MNQILSVDPAKSKKRRGKASERSILIVFSVFLMIFGIGLTSTGAYSFYKNSSKEETKAKNEVSAEKEPTITIERESANLINIVVIHDKEIKNVTYTINGEEPVVVDGEGRKEVKQEVDLPVGNADITITAEDINGVISEFSNSYNIEQKPTIQVKQEQTKIKIIVESSINIDYISYYWDSDEQNATEIPVNTQKTQTLVDALEGMHTLNILAVDVEGNQTIKNQKVKGDNKPQVKVTKDAEGFVIQATDDEKIQKVEITLNENETITEVVNEKEYTKNIKFEQDVDKLTVVVYNVNNIIETVRVKHTKE